MLDVYSLKNRIGSEWLVGLDCRISSSDGPRGFMPVMEQKEAAEMIPQGYVVIPVHVEQTTASLRIGVLVRCEPDRVAGHLVVLRHTVDARVLLGAITDCAGRVQRWIELWIQSLDGLTSTMPAYVQGLSNDILDRRWQEQIRSFDTLDPASVIRVGWETDHPDPVFLDVTTKQPVHPVDSESGNLWQLCQDDVLLEEKKLPRYSTSLDRYLFLESAGSDSAFVPITSNAPTNASCQSMSQIIADHLVPLNPGGGLMLIRPFYPVGFEPFVELLSGGSWKGVAHGKSVIEIALPSQSNSKQDKTTENPEGWLFMGSGGRSGRIIESLHLKLRVLNDMIESVSSITQQTQKPFFNLTPSSFQVAVGQRSSAMPYFWSAHLALVDPGVAVAMPIQTSEWQYYLPGRDSDVTIYHPQSFGRLVRGKGSLRIRQVLLSDGKTLKLEGTLSTEDDISPAGNDLAWLRLNLNGQQVDLFAHLDRETAMAAGEWRFRTIDQKMGKDQQAAFREAEGVPMIDTPFELVPLLSSPCDLYAMGVLAVRTLLVDLDTKLPVALDEVLSLAKQLASDSEESTDLATRIGTIFASDPRWTKSLGPHHLTHETIDPHEAFDAVPPQLWWAVLAMLVRMFPGTGPACLCRDFGHAPQGGIHKIYDRVLHDLERLMLRTRSLIVIDWRINREIHSVLRKFTIGITSP